MVARIPGGRLAPLVEAARQRWPGLRAGADEDFERFLCERGPADDSGDWLERRAVAALYLAWACLAGDPQALALLDPLCASVAEEVTAHHGWIGAPASELRGNLLRELLVASDGRAPKLAQYGGRGPIVAFLR